jgi:hypothetical protein
MTNEEAWVDLCEKSDRSSPEGQPDMALINQAELYDYLDTVRAEGRAEREKLEAALREANDKARDFWQEWAAKRLDIDRTQWLRAAKVALDHGDMRGLRLRVDRAEAPPVAITLSDAQPAESGATVDTKDKPTHIEPHDA